MTNVAIIRGELLVNDQNRHIYISLLYYYISIPFFFKLCADTDEHKSKLLYLSQSGQER